MIRILGVAAFMAFGAVSQFANAGWGHHHGYAAAYGSSGYGSSGYGSSGGYSAYGSSGGSSGYSASYGSSGGYVAPSYGSSGYSVGYGSSGSAYSASYGSSGSAYSAGYGSSGGYVHVGPLRRLAARIHAHHAARYTVGYGSSGYAVASYGSSGGGYYGGSSGGSSGYTTSYGSSGGSSGGYSSSSYYGSSGSTYGSSGSSYNSGVIYESSPTYSSPAPATVPSTNSSYYSSPTYEGAYLSTMNSSVSADEIHLMVQVPEAARVFVNGNPTTSGGGSRHFVSRGLEKGSSYRFEVRVDLEQNGRTLSESKTVVLAPGRDEQLVFAMTAPVPQVKETVLTLNVPADAQVVLAGNPTKSSGEARTYRTNELKSGEVWDDYKIVVTHNGLVKEKTIRLIGGDDMKISFEFDSAESDRLVSR